MKLHKEEGFSLAESLVAMAILLLVLVPSAMFLTFIGSNFYIEDKMESYQLARNELEHMIATENDSSAVLHKDNWIIKRSVFNQGDLYHLKVEVFENDTLRSPLIHLETARIWNKDP